MPRKLRSILDRLSPGEASQLLRALLTRHPELLPEAEEITGAAVAAVDIESALRMSPASGLSALASLQAT